MRHLALTVCLLLPAADAAHAQDAGDVDAGVADAGPLDGGAAPVEDAGLPLEDAGRPLDDAGIPVEDAGLPLDDAGPPPVVDAGLPPVEDAGPPCVPGCIDDQSAGVCNAAGELIAVPCEDGDRCIDGVCRRVSVPPEEDAGPPPGPDDDAGPPPGPDEDAGPPPPCDPVCLDGVTLGVCGPDGELLAVPCNAGEACTDAQCVPAGARPDGGVPPGGCQPGCLDAFAEGACSATGEVVRLVCDDGESCRDGTCKPSLVDVEPPVLSCGVTGGGGLWLALIALGGLARTRFRTRLRKTEPGRAMPGRDA